MIDGKVILATLTTTGHLDLAFVIRNAVNRVNIGLVRFGTRNQHNHRILTDTKSLIVSAGHISLWRNESCVEFLVSPSRQPQCLAWSVKRKQRARSAANK